MRVKVVISILVVLVGMLGALLYRAEKRLHTFANQVEFNSKMLLFDSFAIQKQIDDLDSMKTDTGAQQQRRYEFIKDNFERQNAFTLFVTATAVNDIGSNRDSLNALTQAYRMALIPIQTFFITHDSVSELSARDMEKLQQNYRTLQSVSKRFEDMRLNLW